MVDNSPGPGRTLAAGALSTRDVVGMALASSGSTQSVAVSLAAILATVAYAAKFQWLWAIFEYLLILGFWKNVMIVAVLGGTLASLQAAIVSSARISFAMGRDRGIPSWFGRVAERRRGGVGTRPGRPRRDLVVSSRLVSSRAGKAAFYSDPSVSHGDTVEAELAAASGPTAGPEAD